MARRSGDMPAEPHQRRYPVSEAKRDLPQQPLDAASDPSSQRPKAATDGDWELVPRGIQTMGDRETEVGSTYGGILLQAGDWLQWGLEGALKGVEKTYDGLSALMHYKRLQRERKEALELASRQQWALLELEQQRRRERQRAEEDEAARQKELARELLLVEKVQREKEEAERRWKERVEALVTAKEVHESAVQAKQAELDGLRGEAERRAQLEQEALKALEDLKLRQQAQQEKEREAARLLEEREGELRAQKEVFTREIESLRERLNQVETEAAARARNGARGLSCAAGPAAAEAGEENSKRCSSGDWPDEFYCSITMEVMQDPVLAADGFSYERVAIQDWLDKGNRTSPKTGAILKHDQLLPNLSLKSLIQDRLSRG